MDDIDFTSLTEQITSTTGIVHHQTKLDVFIIRSYKLVSPSSVIHSNTLQSVISSPQTSNTTPVSTSTSTSLASGTASNSLQPSEMNQSNSGNTPMTNPHIQNGQIFGKISKLYNAIMSIGSIDDRSTSPKSPMELYQRFKQIIKELELSYEVSPYTQYFTRLDDGIWQIKEDSELINDQLWQSVSVAIFSVYDPRTGQLINQGRGKKNSVNNTRDLQMGNETKPMDLNANNGNSGNIQNNNNNMGNDKINDSNNDNISNTSNNGGNSINIGGTNTNNDLGNNNNNVNNNSSNSGSNVNHNNSNNNNNTTNNGNNSNNNSNNANNDNNGDGSPSNNTVNNTNSTFTNNGLNPTISSMLMDASLPQQLQKRLQSISQEVNSRSLNGYYTQPTSPGYSGFSFNQTETDPNAQINYNDPGTNNLSIWKRKSLSSLDVDTLDDVAVEELLQLTNTNKKQRINQLDSNSGINNNDMNSTNSGGVDEVSFPDNSATNTVTNPVNTQNNLPPVKQTKTKTRTRNARSNTTGTRRGKNNKATIADTKPNESMLEMSIMNDANAMMNSEIITKQLKGTYDALILEKDQRIIQLERELELQRQETQWLRKMLIEDMGCIRSLLTDLRR
ncbi:hypothetical protein Kpol_400p2 [Vanderwaltozyma polyspora DSM 70294]|uniref:Uncharacterized protein n=1 Tax=Vanderwaltozyma polyspora (strain ATCC 22028 / DSM 70294 / BCRC 21397 / CBS 2163 / NBRC 10782 / NRRL Y-8283 / UCD 57-17) TaxID=436907 RepID=A7TRU1_VANPO|nr:uncharacterized protein Kpol_400p2 [Vanderwaltozyma polyspora DSM 70294]EDO15008.1 hypothetical protein Kpol_400p2 [Vanderwaltozyma polyspora DSM 70294]